MRYVRTPTTVSFRITSGLALGDKQISRTEVPWEGSIGPQHLASWMPSMNSVASTLRLVTCHPHCLTSRSTLFTTPTPSSDAGSQNLPVHMRYVQLVGADPWDKIFGHALLMLPLLAQGGQVSMMHPHCSHTGLEVVQLQIRGAPECVQQGDIELPEPAPIMRGAHKQCNTRRCVCVCLRVAMSPAHISAALTASTVRMYRLQVCGRLPGTWP